MKRIVAVAALVLAAIPAFGRDTPVKGTFRKDGAYVEPHRRTTPNNTRADNYSSRPNVNPYNGKAGRVDPYSPKPLAPKR